MSTKSKFHKLLATTSGGTLDSNSTALEVLNYGVRQVTQRSEDEGARGTRVRRADRVTEGLKPLSGPFSCNPTPAEWDFYLQWLTGGTKSGNNIPFAETITGRKLGTYFGSTVDRWFEHDGCVLASGQIDSNVGQKVQFTGNVIGTTETAIDPGSTAFPSGTYSTDSCYMHHNLVVTLGGSVSSGAHSSGSTYRAERVGISFDNGVDPYFRNSQTATDLTAGDRAILVTLLIPFTSTERVLFTSSLFAAKFVWTMGGQSLTLIFPALKAELETPTVPGQNGEVLLPLNCRAYATGSETQEMFITNDITA